jgi:hypothetical protein
VTQYRGGSGQEGRRAQLRGAGDEEEGRWCCIVFCSTVLCNCAPAAQHRALLQSTVLCCTAPCSAAQHRALLHSTVLCCTAPCSAARFFLHANANDTWMLPPEAPYWRSTALIVPTLVMRARLLHATHRWALHLARCSCCCAGCCPANPATGEGDRRCCRCVCLCCCSVRAFCPREQLHTTAGICRRRVVMALTQRWRTHAQCLMRVQALVAAAAVEAAAAVGA